jgi:hypothetical protein
MEKAFNPNYALEIHNSGLKKRGLVKSLDLTPFALRYKKKRFS